jgi:hypothetical protein
MTSAMKILACVALLGLVVLGTIGPAQASITLDLRDGNTALSGYTGPYGQVTVDEGIADDGNILNITLTSYSGYLFGDGSTIALNLVSNGTIQFQLDSFANDQNTALANTPYSFTPGQQVDDQGSYNFTLNLHDGYASAVHTLSFTLTGTSGNWTDDDNLLTENAAGHTAAGHVFVVGVGDALSTGFAGSGPYVPSDPGSSNVPEPATLIVWSLLGAMSWLGMRVWRGGHP